MRALVVLAVLACATFAVAAVPAPAAAQSQCTVQGYLDPDTMESCIRSGTNPCHFAYPHPCA